MNIAARSPCRLAHWRSALPLLVSGTCRPDKGVASLADDGQLVLISEALLLGDARRNSSKGCPMIQNRLLSLAGFAVLASSFALAGCNQTSSSATPVASAAAASVQMPAGAGCTARIGRFRTVIEKENRIGQVCPSVYRQVEA